MKKKTNPRKIPRTEEDVRKAERFGQTQGVELTFTIFFTALLDKGFVPRERIPDLWDACLYVSDSIIKGYCNVYEQRKMLQEEYGIKFSDLRA